MYSRLMDTELRQFQEEGSDFQSKRRKIITHVGKGLGKTVMHVKGGLKSGAERFMTNCSSNALNTWIIQARRWFPEYLPYITIIEGSKNERKHRWDSIPATGPVMIVSTYQTLQSDMGMRRQRTSVGTNQIITKSDAIAPAAILSSIQQLGADEFHKVMRNRDTVFTDMYKTLLNTYRIPMVNFISGSAISKGPQDIWPALNLIDPKLFGSFWRYVSTYCLVDDSGFGKTILGTKQETAAGWRQVMGVYYFHRSKEQLKDQLPDKLRHMISLEMDPLTRKVYNQLADEQMIDFTRGESDNWLEDDNEDGGEGTDYTGENSIEALLMQQSPELGTAIEGAPIDMLQFKSQLAAYYTMRLLCICPKAVHPSLPYGVSIEYIMNDIEDSETTHNVIYTPFKKPIQHIIDCLHHRKGKYLTPTYVLKGGITRQRQEGVIEAWKKTGGTIICTVKYAQSFELIECTNPYILGGGEWDPEENEQAEDRHNRLSSTETCCVWYPVITGSADEAVIDMNINKRYNVGMLLNPQKYLKAHLAATHKKT